MRRTTPTERDRGLWLTRWINRWLAAGAVGVTGLIAVHTADAYRGHSHPSTATPSQASGSAAPSGSATSSAPTTNAPAPSPTGNSGADSAPSALQPPAQAPSSGPSSGGGGGGPVSGGS